MQVLAVCRRLIEGFSEAAFAELLEAEAEGARRLYASGILRSAWSRVDTPGACLLFEAEDVDAVRAAMGALPLFARGMLDVQFIPLQGYRGFGPRS